MKKTKNIYGKKKYLLTKKPKLYCPECKTHLKISNINKKLWCEDCYEYIDKDKLVENYTRGIE